MLGIARNPTSPRRRGEVKSKREAVDAFMFTPETAAHSAS
jgi:hypothetical protein